MTEQPEHVEARSLASLNYLAANPPQYPKKPTEERQDPITLYISRVPGTRDIILSTLKPQVKNVTAEDVASSLYYVHLDLPEDEPLLPPNQSRASGSPRSSDDSLTSQIPRKPLPSTLDSAPSRLSDVSGPRPSSNENQGYGGPVQHPLRMGNPVPESNVLASQKPTAPPMVGPSASIRRKPLQSRPAPAAADPNSVERHPPPVPAHDPPPAYESSTTDERPPPLPTRPTTQPTAAQPADPFAPYTPPHPLDGSRSPSPTKRRPFMPFSLTLIRRDPSSGQQWNVGKVASFQLENPELISDEKHQQPSPSVSIHLETSGYAKFRGMPAKADIKTSLDLRPGSASSGARLQIPELNTQIPASGTFERQVMMTYSPSFTANLRQRFRRRSSLDEGRSMSPMPGLGHGRQGSAASVGSFGGDFDGGEAPKITQPAPGLKPRGYMFTSPWDGRCEFLTGNGGRSLKCRHVLPSFGGRLFNPLVDRPETEQDDSRAKQTQLISELRFNLPSSELFAEKRSTEGGVRARDQIQTQFNKALHKAQGHGRGDNDDSDDDFFFDLSLGREKAGGGNRGKRAKMGKLIVCEEGLKMLDLVVAANVGVWWISWERTC